MTLGDLSQSLVVTDSADAYASILCGNPHCAENQDMMCLSCVRDVSEVLAISFAGKRYNLAESGAKVRGDHEIVHIFPHGGYFKVGVLARREMSKRKSD